MKIENNHTTIASIPELLQELNKKGVQLWVDGERLRYRAPEGALADEQRRWLNDHKSQVIAHLSQPRTYPLSFSERSLWFLHQLDHDRATYISQAILRLSGQLDVTALERTLAEIIRRHDILRTKFTDSNGEALQVVTPPGSFSLPRVDLRSIPAEAREEEIERYGREQRHQPFDLTQIPLFRPCLLQVDEKEHVLLLTMPHLITDGWSMAVLGDELTTLYAAFRQGKPSPLPELPAQYGDFTLWQQSLLQDDTLAKLLTYWKTQLEGMPALLDLPTDRPRPAIQNFKRARQPVVVSKNLTDRLRALGQQADATLFMMLLAVYKTLLYRYTGQNDLVVGVPFANRNRAEFEGLLGYFVNTLVLRTELSGRSTFEELLQEVRKVCLGAYAHQDLPFEKLVESLQPERDSSYTPLFQVMFGLRNAPMAERQFAGLTLRTAYETEVNFDLYLYLWPDKSGELHGFLEYDANLFNADTITRMIGHYQTLLAGIVADPGQSIAELPLLTETERHQLLVEWNETATDYPKGKCIHRLFEEQVERTPHAVAVVFEGVRLTYLELNQRANQLAHYLIQQGVGPHVLVGICVERSIELMVGLLGILKAGGAYVPLDTAYPAERLALVLEDTNAPILLTQQRLAHLFTKANAKVIVLDTQRSDWAHQPEANPHVTMRSNASAYVIYTSGSTGIPKGVTIPHFAINRLLCNTDYIDIRTTDCIAQVSNASFDAATFEIWGALAHGATLVVIPRHVTLEPKDFADSLRRHEISILFLTTALFNQIVRAAPDAFATLHYLLFGGEAVDPTTVRMVLEHGSPDHLLHVYGPTESTTFSTWHAVESVSANAQTVPIGGPLANTKLYVLDPQMQPVPVGVTGELYIGGDGLALEYHNQPELTREKFIVSPFTSKEHPERLYRTGDLVRWLPNGDIVFLGRSDNQVKLRGYRIELGEIETTLTNHPNIQEAVVVAREDRPGDKQLVGYLVAGQVDDGFQTAHVAEWQSLYEDTYGQTPQQENLSFNLSGWNSSYSAEPIPEKEMAEWIDCTVADIRRLQPTRILEIGCGTGLLLSRLAPDATEYWGTDYSLAAIQHVEQLKAATPALSHVYLDKRMADDFTGIDEDQFDCVILNSVIQYFPSIDYLLTVLAGAVRAVKPGGTIYVGNVRNLCLLPAYHTAVQLAQATDELSLDDLHTRIRQRQQDEEELLIDPDFFYALRQHFPQIAQVDVQLKRGHFQNELTQFRYQVVLRMAPASSAGPLQPHHSPTNHPRAYEEDWRHTDWTPETFAERLTQALQRSSDSGLVLRNIPNARVQESVQTLTILEQKDPRNDQIGSVAQLRTHLVTLAQGVDPEALWALEAMVPYRVHVAWSRSPGMIDAYFVPQARSDRADTETALPLPESTPRPWRSYANNPLLGRLNRTLVSKVRAWLGSCPTTWSLRHS